ncbi:MAG TPA: NAD-dependent epimerase/dehydratase family protein [Pseudogracilibacillus sp.]|nr:NAD-dependent epimerase/dehydratase family protein [Pseudogracilibacillus sp.]
MKALVTGGAGFIGSHIVDALLQEGLEVVVIDNLSNSNREHISSAVKLYEIDMFDQELENVFAQERPDFVFHQAAQISVARSMSAPEEDARMNILGTIHVVQCAMKYQVKRFIFASSAAVYGKPEFLPISENQVLQPTSFYGMSKAFAEEYIRLFSSLGDMKYSIFRYANVYGPRQNINGEAGVIVIFLNKLLAGKPLNIYGDGLQTRDFIYVKDIARACIKALLARESNIINLSTNKRISIRSLADTLSNITGEIRPIQHLPAKEGDILHSSLDNQLAREKLGWSPNKRLEQGLLETYNYIYSRKRTQQHIIS